jgi:hypothetical protein
MQPASTSAQLGLEAGENHVAQARAADRRRQRRRADRPYRGGADARDQHRQRERRLDQTQFLHRRHADGVRRLDHRGIDAVEAGDPVADDRQQRIERQREQRGEEAQRGYPAARGSG